jgi:glyoxylase-like metal-dependent hydrolase (beta-lactamase superfamily II)
LEEVKKVSDAPIFLHPDAVEMLRGASMSAAFFGVRMASPPPPDDLLVDGQQLQIGNIDLEVILAPGHAPGHVAFYVPDYQVIFGGDVLFQGGIGRTDLPGGDYELLMQSISQKFLTLPDETKVFPGHGPATTIEQERLYNPFIKQIES